MGCVHTDTHTFLDVSGRHLLTKADNKLGELTDLDDVPDETAVKHEKRRDSLKAKLLGVIRARINNLGHPGYLQSLLLASQEGHV